MQGLLRPGTPFGPVKCRAAGSLVDVSAHKDTSTGALLGERTAGGEAGKAGPVGEAWTDVGRMGEDREGAERPCPGVDASEGEGRRGDSDGNATDTAQESVVRPNRESETFLHGGTRSSEVQAQGTAAAGASAAEAPPESSGSALLDLLDDGWFMGNVAWSGGGWGGGGWSLSTIKEAQDEGQGEDEEGDEDGGGGGERAGDAQGCEGTAGAGLGTASARVGQTVQIDFSSPPRESSGLDARELPSLSRDPALAEQEAPKPLVFSARRRPISPYSSDEETVQSSRASRSRRGRSGVRQRRTKRSSSADTTARGPWLVDPNQEGSTKGGTNVSRVARAAGSHPTTPPSQPTEPPPPVDERTGRPRFLRTRSVSDYETRGPRVTSLWNTPPGVASKPKSLTDADVEELQGFFDLGFKFQQDQISPQITATLPALRLYQVVGTVQQRLLQRQSLPAQAPLPAAESAPTFPARAPFPPQGRQVRTSLKRPKLGRGALSGSAMRSRFSQSRQLRVDEVQLQGDADPPVGFVGCDAAYGEQATSDALLRSSASASSLPGENSWSIADPNDNPVDVKTNLRLWAQAVASTVRQTC